MTHDGQAPYTNGVKLGRFFVPKGRQDSAGGFSRLERVAPLHFFGSSD